MDSSWQPRRRQLPPLEPGVIIIAVLFLVAGIGAYRQGRISSNSIAYFVALVPAIVLHEVSHGWVARIFGDHTAERAGRLTLNPLRHVDVIGTFILPILLILSTGMAFGYAKPVPVNTTHMSRNRSMLVGLAGPLINIALAGAVAVFFHLYYAAPVAPAGIDLVLRLVFYFGLANVILATFNLIPIPPLDGASVLERFLPQKYEQQYYAFRRYSMLLLLAILLFFNSALDALFTPAISLWESFLP